MLDRPQYKTGLTALLDDSFQNTKTSMAFCTAKEMQTNTYRKDTEIVYALAKKIMEGPDQRFILNKLIILTYINDL